MRFDQLIPILQTAIGPVILISGVGLLLLTMTNRYGRIIDRARHLADASRRASAEDRTRLLSQLQILYRRARLVRAAIALAAVSVLLAAVLIVVLFFTALLRWELAPLIVTLFVGGMGALVGSLILFLKDLNLSLAALKLEVKAVQEEQA